MYFNWFWRDIVHKKIHLQRRIYNMKKIQSGFTLIELVIVIMILGLLSVVAVPKFANLQDDAHQSVVDGASGSFKDAIELTSYKHTLDGFTGSIELQGNTISFITINGGINQYATASTINECAQLWNNITDGMRASSIDGEEELLSISAGKGHCAYIYQETHTITYESVTGNVTTVQHAA